MRNLRTKIEEAIANILAYDPLHKDERQGGYTGHSNCDIDYPRARKELADQISTIFKEEIDQKFRKHKLPTNCSWAMAIKEQIQFDEEYGLYWDFTGTEKDGTSFTKEDLLALINSLEEGKGQ